MIKLIVAGNILVRFNKSGTIDSTYGINGKATNYIQTNNAKFQTDGKLLITNSPFIVTRYKGTEPIYVTLKKSVVVAEGNTGITSPALFKVILNKLSPVDVFINYTTKNLNALAGSDYTATSGTLRIKAGKITGNIAVPIIGDNTREANERFALVLNNPVNAVLGTLDSAVCVIKNDDPSFALTNAAIQEDISIGGKYKFAEIYPNPVKDVLNIQGLDTQNKIEISYS
jgi:hypothetical protein